MAVRIGTVEDNVKRNTDQVDAMSDILGASGK